jgi:hypothetical protein
MKWDRERQAKVNQKKKKKEEAGTLSFSLPSIAMGYIYNNTYILSQGVWVPYLDSSAAAAAAATTTSAATGRYRSAVLRTYGTHGKQAAATYPL